MSFAKPEFTISCEFGDSCDSIEGADGPEILTKKVSMPCEAKLQNGNLCPNIAAVRCHGCSVYNPLYLCEEHDLEMHPYAHYHMREAFYPHGYWHSLPQESSQASLCQSVLLDDPLTTNPESKPKLSQAVQVP